VDALDGRMLVGGVGGGGHQGGGVFRDTALCHACVVAIAIVGLLGEGFQSHYHRGPDLTPLMFPCGQGHLEVVRAARPPQRQGHHQPPR
jgi:hypothetical protein